MDKPSRSLVAPTILALIAGSLAVGMLASPAAAQERPAGGPGGARDPSGYLAQVKPLLQARCYACHGSLKQRAGLRLDTVRLMLRGGDSGPAITAGNADASLLIERVSADDVAWRMPPRDEGEPLSPDQIGLLRAWIVAGAAAPEEEQPEADPREHWAFRPIARPPVPRVGRAGWARNPIDAFIARRHEELAIAPRPEATRSELLRRLSIDLIGLPPTVEQLAEARSDTAPDWYERAVDRLLDDPRHGERWARHWMDVWRYSDWWGLGDQLRNSQKHIWHWRDWIVESLNADTPYDEMVRLMLAADELRPDDPASLRATGYLARNYFLFNRNAWMDEVVEHVGKGFLGLTLNCAKCHDHKYDPIAQRDYYRMRAFFEPYHVRLDVVPGEPDLDRDGIPRAFDGWLDVPTYRFIRGNESNPDKSAPLDPAVPSLLAFGPLRIEPVPLPVEAWQPERRAWVLDAHRDAAARELLAAEALIAPARERLAAAQRAGASLGPGEAGPDPAPAETADPAVLEARLELAVAEEKAAAARAGLESVEQRARAMRLGWETPPEGAEAARCAALAASRAERQHTAALARVALAEAELRRHRAGAEQKEAADKEAASAREALQKALEAVEKPGDPYTKLAGARWTPTRFLNSGKDDPEVTFPPTSTGRRKALAEWITDRRNPLAARVAVNHIWARHMGAPLVATVFDFGRKGSPPSHPELLDWLAAELIESGWSMKHLHRLIVESATYRLSCSAEGADDALAHDPDNTTYWRRTAVRLESQAVRDAILALAGTLDARLGGPPVPPSGQAESTRRSLYFFHSNNDRNPFLTAFDEAPVKECYRREQSIVPQQALALTNSRLVLDAAGPIAERLSRRRGAGGGPADDAEFARLAFLVLLGRDPDEAEAAAMTRAVEAWKGLPEAGQAAEASRFARANLVWALLNHNDFVTLR
jgi:hypothetical protein